MNEEKKNPRWLSFLNGVALWLVVGFLGYGLITTYGLRPGSCLTEQQMAFLGLTEIIIAALMVLGFICGSYQFYLALKEGSE